jgi:hypothetical protein
MLFPIMSLNAIAKHLAHRFERLRGYFHKELELLRDFARCWKAAKSRSPAEAKRIAVHEAGHVVVLIALGLAFSAVSIIPNVRNGTLGQVFVAQGDVRADLAMLPREAVYLRYAMVYYAGAEAVRQLLPADANPDAGAGTDKRNAANLIRYGIGGDAELIDFHLSLAKRRCALLVEHYGPEIQGLAHMLEAKLIVPAKTARKVFLRSLTQRSGQLLTFKSDPTLKGLAGDDAFRAFLRRLNLPKRAN